MATAALHRLYDGSPCKIKSPGAIVRLARDSGIPIYKGRKLEFEELENLSLNPQESLITHTHRLEAEFESVKLLAELGCGEEVLVVEGVFVLEAEYNGYLTSFKGMREYKEDMEVLGQLAAAGSLAGLKRAQQLIGQLRMKGTELSKDDQSLLGAIGNPSLTMSKFCRGLMLAGTISPDLEKIVHDAASGTGIAILRLVLDAVRDDFPENHHLRYLSLEPRVALASWDSVHDRRTNRNVLSHPFAMIGPQGTEKATKAAMVLGDLSSKYPDLQMLIEASMPLIWHNIDSHHNERTGKEKSEEVQLIFERLGI